MQTNSSQNQLSSFQQTFAQNLNFSEESAGQHLSGSDLSQIIGRQAAAATLTNQQKTSVKARQNSFKPANIPSLLQPGASANLSTATVTNNPLVASQIADAQIKPSSTSKPIKPEQSKKVTSSSERANNPGLSLTPDITHSLLGFAQNMVSNLEQQELSSLPTPPPSAPPQWTAPSAAVGNNQKSAAVAASKAALDYINMQNQSQHLQTPAPQFQPKTISKKSNGYDITSLLNQQVPAQMSMAKPRTKTSSSSRIASTPLTHSLPGPPSLPPATTPNRSSPQMPLMSPTVQMPLSPQVTPQLAQMSPQLPQMSPQHLAEYQQQYADLHRFNHYIDQ